MLPFGRSSTKTLPGVDPVLPQSRIWCALGSICLDIALFGRRYETAKSSAFGLFHQVSVIVCTIIKQNLLTGKTRRREADRGKYRADSADSSGPNGLISYSVAVCAGVCAAQVHGGTLRCDGD